MDALTGVKETSTLKLPQISTRRSVAGFNFPVISSPEGDRIMSLNRMQSVGNDRFAVRLIDKHDSEQPLLFSITLRENKAPYVVVTELTQATLTEAQLLDPKTDIFKVMRMRPVPTEHISVGNPGTMKDSITI